MGIFGSAESHKKKEVLLAKYLCLRWRTMKNNLIRKSAFKQVKLDYLMDLFNVGRVSVIADLVNTILMPPKCTTSFSWPMQSHFDHDWLSFQKAILIIKGQFFIDLFLQFTQGWWQECFFSFNVVVEMAFIHSPPSEEILVYCLGNDSASIEEEISLLS